MVSDSISTCFMSQQLELLNDPPTLPSWDFSDDLLLGLDPYGDTSTSLEETPSPGVGTPAEQPFSAEQAGPSTAVAQLERASKPARGVRKQSQNRQAQHRFRQRQKVRCRRSPKCKICSAPVTTHAHVAAVKTCTRPHEYRAEISCTK